MGGFGEGRGGIGNGGGRSGYLDVLKSGGLAVVRERRRKRVEIVEAVGERMVRVCGWLFDCVVME